LVVHDFYGNEKFIYILDLETPDLRVGELDHSTVMLHWNVVDGAAFFNLTIYDSDSGNQVQSYTMNAETNADKQQSFGISGLESESSYFAQLFAISESGVKSSKNDTERFNTCKFYLA